MLRKDRDTLSAIAEVFEAALEGTVDGEGSGDTDLRYSMVGEKSLNPTEDPDIRFSQKDPEALTIKGQITAHQNELNAMDPVAVIEIGIRPQRNGRPDKSLMRKELQAYYGSMKYSVDRKGFGAVQFDEKAMGELCGYINNDAEFAAAKAAPAVVKRGIEIDHHTEHKGRESVESFTFAAPVMLNGKRGNEVVVVQITNRRKPHSVRILLPDGSGFDLTPIKKSGPNHSRANLSAGSEQLMQPTFDTSISEDGNNGNLRFSQQRHHPCRSHRRAGGERKPQQRPAAHGRVCQAD